jgi:hypothetical protein
MTAAACETLSAVHARIDGNALAASPAVDVDSYIDDFPAAAPGTPSSMTSVD